MKTSSQHCSSEAPEEPRTTILVFPGLDGTDLLLDSFRQLAPVQLDVVIHALPDEASASYQDLLAVFDPIVAATKGCVLIGESFSGPLAVLLAHRYPEVVRRVILVASFVDAPLPRIATWLPWRLLFRIPIPRLAARWLTGGHTGLYSKLRAASKVQSPETLASRVRLLTNVDVSKEFAELDCEITYLRPSQDSLVSARHAESMLRLNANTRISRLDGPHLILQAEPAEAWERIIAAIDSTSS